MAQPERQDPHPDEGRVPSGPGWESEAVALIADVVTVFRDGVFEWASPSVTGMLGYAPEEIVGRTTTDFVHPDDAAFTAADLPSRSGEVRSGGRIRLLHKDGTFRWVESLLTRHVEVDGSLGAVLMSTRDIGEQVRLEEELRAAERTLRTALDASPDGFAVHRVRRDEHGGVHGFAPELVNRSAASMFGFGSDVVLERSLEDVLPASEATRITDLLRRAAAGEGTQRLRTTFAAEHWEGTLDVIAVRVDDGHVLATWRDVTVEVQAELVLIEAYARAQDAWDTLHAVLDAAPDGMLLVELDPDPDPELDPYLDAVRGGVHPAPVTIVHANGAATALLGRPRDLLVGHDLLDAFPAPSAVQVVDLVVLASVTRAPQTGRLPLRPGPDAGGSLVEATATPIGDGRVVVVCRDVTRQDAEHRLLDRRRLQAEHAASHDPLTGLPNRGRLEQVLRGALLACDPTERVAVLVCGVADVLAAQGLRGGDDLLRQVTDRLRDALGDDDTLAYAGRGQYVVVRPRVAPEESGQHVLERLHAAAVAAVAPAATSGAVPVQMRSYLADPARNVHDREPADVLANALAVVPRAG